MESIKFYINGQEVKKVTKFKLKRSFWQMIKDKIEFAKNKRRQAGCFEFCISEGDFEYIKNLFEQSSKKILPSESAGIQHHKS